MIEDWIVVTGGVVAVIVIMAAAVLKLRSTERRMTEISYKLKVYTDLLNAITELNLASGDVYKMESAKKNLALTLNRLNLVGSSGVLKKYQRSSGLFERTQGQGIRYHPPPQYSQYHCD